jgi:hypothetical protein
MRRPDPVERSSDPVPPWTLRHVPTPAPDDWLFPRALAILAVCLFLLLGTGLGDQARGWIVDFLDLHAVAAYAGDRNGLIQPGNAR